MYKIDQGQLVTTVPQENTATVHLHDGVISYGIKTFCRPKTHSQTCPRSLQHPLSVQALNSWTNLNITPQTIDRV